MNYKCIFCDLDETLLDEHKQIHPDNIKSIQSLKNKNIKFNRRKYKCLQI